MKSYILIQVLFFISINTFSQADSTTIIKFKSTICRSMYREQVTDAWNKTDIHERVFFIFNSEKKTITALHEDKKAIFDILNVYDSGTKSTFYILNFNCLDEIGNQCKIQLANFEYEPFYISVCYPLRENMYFLKPGD